MAAIEDYLIGMVRAPAIPPPRPTDIDEVFEQFKAGFSKRKFSAGLLIAFVDMFLHLDTPSQGLKSWEDFLRVFPHQETNRKGSSNTLTVIHQAQQITLRRFYDPVEVYFRATEHRMDYPSCAPHATQAWNEAKYHPWLDVLARSSTVDLGRLREKIVQFILETLPDHTRFDEQEPERAPLFRIALTTFDTAARPGERSGAPFQGLVFGLLRADNPTLMVTAARVRSGSARHGAIGDVDGWNGAKLAISAEVKHRTITEDEVAALFTDFAGRVRKRAAIGLVVALGFEAGASDAIADLGLLAVSHEDMLNHIRLWEPHKQELAVDYVTYYFLRAEMSDPLTRRFQEFVKDAAERFRASAPESISAAT